MLIITASTLFPLLAVTYQFPIFPPETSPSTFSAASSSSTSRALRDRLIHVLPRIETLRNVGGTAGISIGVITNRHVVLDHSLGFADVKRRLVANSSTRYPIASLTKAFVASTIAQLVDKGLLKWDEALTSYLPELSLKHNPLLTVLDDLTPVRVGSMDLTDGSIISSAGGIRSTVGDLLTWGNTLLSLFRDEDAPLAALNTILSGHSFINSTIVFDKLYTIGFAKVITPAQFGKIGFNPGLVDAMPVIGGSSKPEQVFYHSGAGAGYNHYFMLVPGSQSVIVVLTNSISHGDTADWVAQSLLQAVLDKKQPLDLKPFAERAAAKWRGTYQSIANALEKSRKPDSEELPHEALKGKYGHKTRAFYLEVIQEDGALKFNLNGKPEQEHILSHYSDDTFVFLPSAEKWIRSGLFHYSAPA
ncbi:MAG: hypothetical protein Q9217_006329 [Psora testacea]